MLVKNNTNSYGSEEGKYPSIRHYRLFLAHPTLGTAALKHVVRSFTSLSPQPHPAEVHPPPLTHCVVRSLSFTRSLPLGFSFKGSSWRFRSDCD